MTGRDSVYRSVSTEGIEGRRAFVCSLRAFLVRFSGLVGGLSSYSHGGSELIEFSYRVQFLFL